MKRLLTLFVFLVAVVFSYSAIAQEMGSLRKGFQFSIPEKIQGPLGDPIPAGTYSIGTAGDFPTIDSAFNKLSIDGIAGEVTLELIDVLYTAPTDNFGFLLNGPIPGAGTNSRVIIKPAANTNVTIEGSGNAAASFFNTSFVTIDGVDLTGTTTLTFHTIYNNLFDYNICLAFWNNSDLNVIQNTIFIGEDTGFGGGLVFFTLPGFTATTDSNLFQNNFIRQSAIAIYVSADNSSQRATGNIVKDNIIGSVTDSMIAWGIQLEHCQNTIIENNIVQNLKLSSISLENINIGINSYWGNGDIIRNNIVHNIKASAGYTSVGIFLSGNTGNIGLDNLIYNNMVYDINSTSQAFFSRVTGIQLWYQNHPKIYFNSVYLSGTGANNQGSAALYIWNTTTNVEAKNNIFVNTRDESPSWASSIYDINSASSLTSDYNDLFYESNQYNSLVRLGSTIYSSLADWQVTGNDINSITEMPNFMVPIIRL